jgi:hypothetical protein
MGRARVFRCEDAMRERKANEILIIPATMFPNDPAKRAEYERAAAAQRRAKPNPITRSVREQVEREIDRAAFGKG